MCLFVDKIFKSYGLQKEMTKDSLSGEIVSNYYPREESVSGSDEFLLCLGA